MTQKLEIGRMRKSFGLVLAGALLAASANGLWPVTGGSSGIDSVNASTIGRNLIVVF